MDPLDGQGQTLFVGQKPRSFPLIPPDAVEQFHPGHKTGQAFGPALLRQV